MKIREVMTTSPMCCLPSDSASKAARIMKDLDTGIVPVIEDEQNRQVIGVVTDRDLCLNVIAEGQDPLSVQVRRCMTSALVCCTPDDDVQQAVDLMRENRVRRLPVVDPQGTIQGVVSLADVMQRSEISSTQTHDTLKTISEPSEEASKPRSQMYQDSA